MANKTTRLLLVALSLGTLIWLWSVLRGPVLTALPNPDDSPLTVEATVLPERPEAGASTRLEFQLNDAHGNPLTDLMPHHDRLLHVLVIGENLATIGHLHPEDFPAQQPEHGFAVNYRFPSAGRYLLAVDAMQGMAKLSRQFILKVGGQPSMPPPVNDFNARQCVKGHPETAPDQYLETITLATSSGDCDTDYAVTLIRPGPVLKAQEGLRLQFHVEKGGKPVTDLSPYLAAAVHLAIVPAQFDHLLHEHGFAGDGQQAYPAAMDHSQHAMPMAQMDHSQHAMPMSQMDHSQHAMPMSQMDHSQHAMPMDMAGMSHHAPPPAAFGPRLSTEAIVFDQPGRYRLFAQFKHAGQIIVAGFLLEIEEGFADADARQIELRLQAGQLQPDRIQVEAGDQVVLRIASDSAADFHVHGYQLERRLSPGQTNEMRFTANLTGRFDFELHAAGTTREIGALEVYPAGALPEPGS